MLRLTSLRRQLRRKALRLGYPLDLDRDRIATRLGARCDGVLIIAADQPLVDDAALRSLVDAFRAGARIAAAAYSGTIGVPAIVGRERFESLMELGGDAGAGSWLRGRIDEVRSVPMPNAEMDIDGAEDVARLATLA